MQPSRNSRAKGRMRRAIAIDMRQLYTSARHNDQNSPTSAKKGKGLKGWTNCG